METEPTIAQKSEIAKRLAYLREDSERTMARAAQQADVTTRAIRSFESGDESPSLPQLEMLALLYRVPLSQLLVPESTSTEVPGIKADRIPDFIGLRNRIIASKLKQARVEKKLSLKKIAEAAQISTNTLKKYESADLPIPLPALEKISTLLGIRIESLASPLTSQTNKLKEMPTADNTSEEKVNVETPADVVIAKPNIDLPEDLLVFITNPANRPYLELAKKLSSLDAARLRSIAEGLLEITF